MKILDPKPSGTLWATSGLLRDSFTIYCSCEFNQCSRNHTCIQFKMVTTPLQCHKYVYHRQYWVKSKFRPVVHPVSIALMQGLARSRVEVLCWYWGVGLQITEVPMQALWSRETVLTVGRRHRLVVVVVLMTITRW